MKFSFAFLLFIFSIGSRGHAQVKSTSALTDTILARKLTIAGFCLCQTTLADLKNLDSNLKEVGVDEMDMCNDGFAQDMRFVNQKGYYSEKLPGMIFQKDNDNDFISKIRLTKDFVGNLPDGTPVNMRKLLAKDVIKLHPSYATWKSRGCSDYWNLTNDTLSFFVRIDKNKTPQYPVDEAYYAEKPIEGIDLVVSCYGIFTKEDHRYEQLFNDPVFFIDSVNVTRIELQKYKPTDIASVSVYKDSNAIKLVGPQGTDGAVYIETKRFARNKYWSFFKNKSGQYLKLVPAPEADTSIGYILNGKALTTNFESNLSAINDTNFIELIIISKEQLMKDFGITDKKYGVLIKTTTERK